MKKIMSNILKGSIISSITLIALGILLVFKSEPTILTISYVIGAVLIAMGVLAELKYIKDNKNDVTKGDMDIIYGVVCIILGIVVIKNPSAIASVIPLVLGVIIIANSAIKLQYSLELKRDKNELWISTFILSIVMLICGIVLIFNPFTGAKVLTVIVGIFILIYAVLDLVSTFFIKSTLQKIQSSLKEENITEAKVIEDDEDTKKQLPESTKHEKTDKKDDNKDDEDEQADDDNSKNKK